MKTLNIEKNKYITLKEIESINTVIHNESWLRGGKFCIYYSKKIFSGKSQFLSISNIMLLEFPL
jgi:hypothetical protein